MVSNNSTDETRSVVEDFCKLYQNRIRYLFEPRRGKSHALNAGIRQARGDILAFTDDDVTVETNLAAESNFRSEQWRVGWRGTTCSSGVDVSPSQVVAPVKRSHALASMRYSMLVTNLANSESRRSVSIWHFREVFKKYG